MSVSLTTCVLLLVVLTLTTPFAHVSTATHHNRVNDTGTGTVDAVWDALKKTGDLVMNLTRPALDNEIKKESQSSFNTTFLKPLNETVEEHTVLLKYDRSSILLLNSDIGLLKDGVRDLISSTNRTNTRLDQMNNNMGVMNTQIQLTLNNTQHLKTKFIHLQDTVQDNSKSLGRIENKVDEMNSTLTNTNYKVTEFVAVVKGNSLKLDTVDQDLKELKQDFKEIMEWIKKHNTSVISV